MPRGDGTGPLGYGPMTGRGMGFCAGFNAPGYMSSLGRAAGSWFGRGAWPFGRRGGGRGWRNMFYATGLPGWLRFGSGAIQPWFTGWGAAETPDDERRILSAQLDFLQNALENVRKRLAELDKESKND